MTLNVTVNQDLRKIFSSIDNHVNNDAVNNENAKVIIRDGQVHVDSRGRGFFSFRSPRINDDSQNTLQALRQALTGSMTEIDGAQEKIENILKKHLNERQLRGKQRLTLKNLTSIRSSVISLKTIRKLEQEFQQPNQIQPQGNQHGQANHASSRPADLETAPDLNAVRNMNSISPAEKNSLLFLMNLKKNLPHNINTEVRANEDINSINTKIQISGENSNACANAIRKLEQMLAAQPNNQEYCRSCQTLRNHFQYLKTQNDILNTNASGILNHKADLARNFKDSFVSKLQGAQEIISFVRSQIQGMNNIEEGVKNEALNKLTEEFNKFQDKINAVNQMDDMSKVKDDEFEAFKGIASKIRKAIKPCLSNLPEEIRNGLKLSKEDIQDMLTKKLSASDKWDVFENTLHLDVADKVNKPFKFKITPLNKLPNVFVSHDFHDYDISGNPVKNYASGDRKTNHITNLHKTEIADENGNELFSGYRHGTTAAFGIKNSPETKEKASQNRAAELLRTIVEDKYRDKIDDAINRDNAIEIKLSSVSLLTPANHFDDNEKSMFETQCRSWDHFSPSADNPDGIFKIKVRVPDPNHPGQPGPEKEIYIKPSINTFNFPCQIQSVMLKMGWDNSDRRNNDAFNKLVGSSLNNTLNNANQILDPRNDDALNSFVNQIKNDNSDLARFLNSNEPESKKKKAIILALEIKMMQEDRGFLSFSGKEHRQRKVDPYALPARVAMLNHILGNETCFNCKSGKDRTGQLDAEIRTLAATLSEVKDDTDVREYIRNNSDVYDILKNGSYSNNKQKKNLTKVVLNSGNMEIHQMNTGIMGSKVKGSFMGIKIGGGTKYQFEEGAFDLYKGKSDFAKS